MPTGNNVDSWIFEHDPKIRQICMAIRQLIRKIEPSIKETINCGNPVYRKNRDVFFMVANDNCVSLGFFNGRLMRDPDGKLEGTGNRIRYITMRSLEDIVPTKFCSWLREALILDDVPYKELTKK